jgi:hypothetical protein
MRETQGRGQLILSLDEIGAMPLTEISEDQIDRVVEHLLDAESERAALKVARFGSAI